MQYEYYLSSLDDKDAELYRTVYEKILECAESFELGAQIPDAKRIIRAVLMDHPEIFWFEGMCEARSGNGGITVIPKYNGYITVRDETSDFIKKQLGTCNPSQNASDADKIRAVYDWLIANVEYGDAVGDQNAAGAFIARRALCKGVAKAFQLFMNSLDIPSFIAAGSLDGRESHVWNIVEADGEFYHVDVTMGYERFREAFAALGRNKRYPCFMVSTDTVLKTHRLYDELRVSCVFDFDIDGHLVSRFNIPERMLKLGAVRYLDKGSTCTVFLIEGERVSYALKVARASGDDVAERMRECVILKSISDSEFALGLIDSEFDAKSGMLYMLLPYCETLASRRRRCGNFNTGDIINIGIQLLEAMIRLRARSIYHLDIQPKNIYFNPSGRAILGDFGGAAYAHELEKIGAGRGTQAFMAPEVYSDGIYGEASEIYSLGIVLYSLLNGAKLPFFECESLAVAIKKRLGGASLPACTDKRELWEVIKRMCAFDKNERFSVYEDAMYELKRAAVSMY